MYIAPNTTIKLYTFVPLDNSYKNTLWFDDINAQNNYFHGDTGILRKAYTENSYQRVHKNKIRINESADFLYCCSYLAFQNTNYGNKWFYAFILSVEYVNNAVCEITYEIDVMQTYLFDISLKECFVEREHASIDAIGFNIVPEPVELGDMCCAEMTHTDFFMSYSVLVCNTVNSLSGGSGDVGGVYDGLFSGADYALFPIDTEQQIEELKDFLKLANDHPDVILSLTMVPTGVTSQLSQYTLDRKYDNIGGYVPKNNKLFTYPYNYLVIDSGNNSAEYRYEWFNQSIDNKCRFGIRSVATGDPKIAITPLGYNGTMGYNYTEKLVMDGFPQLAWTYDTYRAWLAQESSSSIMQGIASAGAVVGGIATGNPLMSLGGMVGAGSLIGKTSQLQDRPYQSRGTNSGSWDVGTRTKDFYFKRMQIQGGFAKIIDDFFTKYGYAMNYVKVPNRNVRKEFTYTKTKGCVAVGICPADDTRKICDIYDNGITFWKHAENVGNYSVDNSTL